MATEQGFHRVQLSLAPRAYEMLMNLKQDLAASTATEVIRTALSTLTWIREMTHEGYEIALMKDGVTVPMGALLPFSPPGKSSRAGKGNRAGTKERRRVAGASSRDA